MTSSALPSREAQLASMTEWTMVQAGPNPRRSRPPRRRPRAGVARGGGRSTRCRARPPGCAAPAGAEAGWPAIGLGSMASQGSRVPASTLPKCRSVWRRVLSQSGSSTRSVARCTARSMAPGQAFAGVGQTPHLFGRETRQGPQPRRGRDVQPAQQPTDDLAGGVDVHLGRLEVARRVERLEQQRGRGPLPPAAPHRCHSSGAGPGLARALVVGPSDLEHQGLAVPLDRHDEPVHPVMP